MIDDGLVVLQSLLGTSLVSVLDWEGHLVGAMGKVHANNVESNCGGVSGLQQTSDFKKTYLCGGR